MNDADGTPANIRYQWFADGKPIAGATAQTFTLTAAQQGAKITVQATYTDLAQHAEAPQSAATAAVSGLPPQNHAPTDITLSAATVAEGKDGASVGKLTTTDPDAGDAHRYTVSDARFEVTADGTLKLKAGLHLDYAAEKTIALTVTATDAGGLATQKTFTLSVQDDPNYPAPNPQPNPNPQPPSAATLTVRETDDAVSGTLHVGKIAAGEALTVGETTLNAAKLADLAREPRTVIDDAKGTLTLTGYDAASGTLTYRYDPKEHASPNDQQATVDFIIGREAFRGTNGVGVQPFNPRWAGDDSTAIEESYARAAALGVKWVRITAGWNQVQPQDDGSYDWRYVDDAVRLAQKYGMKVLMQVMGTPNWASDIGDLPSAQQQKLAQEGYWTSTHAPKAQHDADFARFFGEAVKRYSAQGIHDFEFWNEPGNKFWRDTWANPNPNPEHYTRLLKLVYEAAHAADAEANVLAGGMTVGDSRADGSYISPQEFLERMYKAGAQGYFDALSHHPYGILAKDYKDNGWAQMNGDIVAPGAGEKTLMQIMQAHGDGGKLIWPSEVGWDAMFAGLAETYQANVLKTLLEWQQKADYTGPMILYQAQNDRAAYVQGILNRDDNGDGIVDVNIDTNGDGIPDANIDADHNNRPDLLDAADREAYYGFWKNDGSEKPAVDAIKQGTPQTPAAATLNITIENVDTPAPQPQNHAPDDITLSTATVAEGKDGTTVGKLTTHDPDSGDTHTYKTSDDRFEVAADGTLKLKAGQHLDYASEPTVKLTVTATDAGGLSTQKTFTLNVQDDPAYPAPNPQPQNQPGSVSITGDAQVGGTLSAQIADADGFNPAQVQYQWQRDGQPIDGATSSQYTLKAEDAGHKISVQARYDDNAAHHETPTSPASDIPAADPHAGALAVTGAAKVGAILTTAITDADGVPQVGIHYQWFADGKAIEGATHEVYRIRPEDIGKSISVQASYTDNSGHAEMTNTAAVAQNVADNPATQGAHGHKLYAHEEFGKYIDARDFGVNPANADNTAALKAALKAADDEGAALYLGAGTLKLHEQLRIGTDIHHPDGSLKQEGYQNVRAIFGAGMGKTKLTFDWQQQGEYDPAHNATDARDLAGVLIDGINGKSIADLSVAYQHQTAADFYRPQASYFGKINGIVVNDADNTRIDTVEVTGANRAGVFFTSTATSLSGARQALIDHQISEADAPAGDNNQLLYSNLHHNRVAGAMIGYQRGFSADSNTAAYNGHEADGGTGYGIATLGGSYNFGVSYTRNITDHNYRKGLDSHEGNHIHIENNIANGDRLVGLGVSNHQFTMDNVTIRHNTIIADPNFRCTSDDGDKDAQIGQGENYHAYEGINLLTNIESNKIDLRSQGPGTFDISDNTIRGLETYNDANTSAIAVHNYEPTMDYTLNIRDNHIDATSVKTAIAINNATRGLGGSAGEGSGDIRVSGNTIHITKTGGRPSSLIYIAETEHDGTLRGSVAIENNRVQIDARDDKGEIIRLTGNAKTYDISGNVLEQHGNSNTTLITINGQGSTEKTTLNVHDNTLAADWPRPGKHWIEAGTESVAGAHIQSHNNTYNGAAITEDAPPAQNHAPDDITLSASQVAEGQDGATVGKLTAHDPDSGDTHTYKTSDDRFEVAADGTLKLKAGQHLDYASEPTVKLTVTATDAGGLSTQKTFTLNVQDDPAYPAPNQPGSISITGEAQVGSTLTATVKDADNFDASAVKYQWFADGNPIGGATAQTFTLTAAQKGAKITVQATYDDNSAHHETPTSAATAPTADDARTPPNYPVTDGNDIMLRVNRAEKSARDSLLKIEAASPDEIADLRDGKWGQSFTERLQKALDDPNIRIIDMPAGTHRISSVVLDRAQDKHIRGQGSATVLEFDKTDDVAPFLATSGGKAKNLLFSEFSLDMSWKTGDAAVNAFQFTNADSMQVYHVAIKNVGGSAILAQGFRQAGSGSKNLLVLDSVIDGAGLIDHTDGFGVMVKDDSPNAAIVGNQIHNVKGGMAVGGHATTLGAPVEMVIIDNHVGNQQSTTAFEGIGITKGVDRSIIAKNISDPSFDNGISVTSDDNLVVKNHIGSAWNHGIAIDGKNNTVVANEIHNIGRQNAALGENEEYAAIAIENGANNYIANNTASGGDMVYAVKYNGQQLGDNQIGHNDFSGYSKREFSIPPHSSDKTDASVPDTGLAPQTATERAQVADEAGPSAGAFNHAPTDIGLSALEVPENLAGATVGKLTTHDPDAGDTHTYKTSDDRFEVTSDGTLKLKAGQHLDYAAEKTVTLTITATDAGGLSTQKTFTLHTTNPADTFARENLPPGATYQTVADLGAAKTAIAANPTLQNLIISDGDHHALLQKNSTGYSDGMPPGWTLTCKNHIPAVAFHDGGADLAPALNAAAQAAKTLQLGIELPAQREYQLGSQIVLENGVPYLHGNGSTLAVQNSVNEAALKLPNGASQGEISGLTLNMNAAPGVHGILGYDLHDYRIHDNHILHLGQRPGHPGYGITVYSGSGHTENITVENNHISAKPSNGAHAHADAPVGIAFNGAQQPGNPQWRDAKAPVWRQYVEDGTVAEADPSRTIKQITVRGNQVSGTYYGVAFSTVSDSEISGNHLHHNTRNISLQDRSNHNTVRDNILTDAHSSAIHIAYASSDNHIENNHIMTTRAGGQAILQAYQGSKNNHYHNNHIDVAHDATTNFMYTATDSSGTTYRDNIASGRVSRASIGAESIWDKAGAGDEKSAYGNNMQDPNLYDGDITHGGGHGALTGLTISGNILAPEPTFAGAPITYLGADSSHGLHGDKTLHGDLDITLNDNTWLGADGREAVRQHQSGDSHVHLHGNGITHADGTTYHHGTTAYSIGDYTLANDETTLYLLGTHATSGSGNSGDNQLYGNAQTNRLSGGAGNDHLDGGYGADTLTGGAGADTFTFASVLDGKNIDTITDFNAGEGDKIALNQAVFGRLGDNWYAAAGQHITHTTRVYQQGDTLYHDPDGSGSAYSATAFAKVNTVLEEGHFSLI